MKWKKEVNKIVIECWIRSEPTKRKYRQRMKQIWNEICVFAVTGQSLADQARQIRMNKWLTDVEIEEIERICQTSNQVSGTDGGTDEGSIEEERNDNGIVARTEGDRQTEGELQVGEEEMNQSRTGEEGNRDVD